MPSQTVGELYSSVEEFSALLVAAELHADGGWEAEFVTDMQAKFKRYGPHTMLSPHQQKKLEQIGKH